MKYKLQYGGVLYITYTYTIAYSIGIAVYMYKNGPQKTTEGYLGVYKAPGDVG